MKKWPVLLSIACILAACEKTLDIQTEKQVPKIVVDAQVEDNLPPVVVLSNSLNYFAQLDVTAYLNMFVHNALVTVSDSLQTVRLKEFQVTGGDTSLYYYSVDPSGANRFFSGRQGKKYTLHIETGGQSYDAVTTIPLLTKKIDSIWWKPFPNIKDTPAVMVISRITDPPGFGNYIRYFTRNGGGRFLPGFNSVYDDQVINDKTYDVQVFPGVNRNVKTREGERDFKRGDTVTVKFCNIDKSTYEFWRTWEYAFESTGNPFASPGKVTGNITNGALGAFCGYAPQYKTLIIPK